RITAAQTGESGILGERAKLNGTPLCILNLIDTPWDILIPDKCLVGSIKKDQAFILQCPVDPLLEYSPGHDSTCGVVGITEIDQIGSLCRYLRQKPILLRTGE